MILRLVDFRGWGGEVGLLWRTIEEFIEAPGYRSDSRPNDALRHVMFTWTTSLTQRTVLPMVDQARLQETFLYWSIARTFCFPARVTSEHKRGDPVRGYSR